jgi:uncharacterized membrane protein YheB (UPF0754 family)
LQLSVASIQHLVFSDEYHALNPKSKFFMELLILPFISAFIGWITNCIAIRMLFRPLYPVNIFGLKIQGVAPRRRHELTEGIANAVQKALVSVEDVAQVIQSINLEREINVLLDDVVKKEVKEKLIEKFPFAKKAAHDLFKEVRSSVQHKLVDHIAHLMNDTTEQLKDKLNIKEIVMQRVASYKVETLEELIYPTGTALPV